MQISLLSIACFLSLVYVTFCNPEGSHKVDVNPSVGEIESLGEQVNPLLQLQSENEDHEKRGDWNKLNGMWGKRDWNNLNNMWGKRETGDLQPYGGKRGWNNLSGVWGKRGWNNLSNVWGKRGWNNLSNVWGKRDWNKLNGMWGKRGWNNLSNVWGKRSGSTDDGWKRTGTSNWNKLNGAWGKRDADWDVPAVWEKVPSEDDTYAVYVPDQM